MHVGEQNRSSNFKAKTDKQEVTNKPHIEPNSNAGSKQPKTIKNVMVAPKHDKVRETSHPVDGNGRSHTSKHQLPMVESTPKTKPRHKVTLSSGPIKQVAAEGGVSRRSKQKTPPSLLKPPSCLGSIRLAENDIPNAANDTGRLDPNKIAQEYKMSHHQLTNSHLAHASREPLKAIERNTKGMQTDIYNSVSSPVSIQGFKLSDFATTFIDMSEPTLPEHESFNLTEKMDSRPDSSGPAKNLSGETSPFTSNFQNSITRNRDVVSVPNNKPHNVHEPKLRGILTRDDKFTVREGMSSVAETAPLVISNKISSQNVLQDKEMFLQNLATERPTSGHLPPPFDDVIHVIRHSSYRMGSEHPVKESMEMGDTNVDVATTDNSGIRNLSLKSSISDHPGVEKKHARDSDSLVLKPNSLNIPKYSPPTAEEKMPEKESL
ncbi:unnamed protein product [Vicia faba]|uniref:Uncharacterized protein n=1 Tax=Vicia faba TaxID=3906 RepID=A0AAV0Z5S7_VICFA|nr:unnamed protein product [Vicia faba]